MMKQTIHGTFYYVGKAVIMVAFLYEKNRHTFTLQLKISGQKKCYCDSADFVTDLGTERGTGGFGSTGHKQDKYRVFPNLI